MSWNCPRRKCPRWKLSGWDSDLSGGFVREEIDRGSFPVGRFHVFSLENYLLLRVKFVRSRGLVRSCHFPFTFSCLPTFPCISGQLEQLINEKPF